MSGTEPPLRTANAGSPAVDVGPCGPVLPVLRSEDLFGATREILIAHAGALYRLRLTHSNKLILTK